MNKIIETLKTKTRSKHLIEELHNLTEKQVEYLENYSVNYPKSLAKEIKGYLKTNARLKDEAEEKKKAFEQKYGKTVSLFNDILEEHRVKIRESVKTNLGKMKSKIMAETKINETQFNTLIEDNIEATIEANEFKLIESIYRYTGNLNITTVKKVYSHFGNQGIEGSYALTLADGTVGTMETQSIVAGGYNIQCLHYRYIISISDSLKGKEDNTMTLTDKEIVVINVLNENIKDFSELEGNQIPNDVMHKVERLKGASRNWSSLIKSNMLYKVEYGNYYSKRYNYFVTNKGIETLNAVRG